MATDQWVVESQHSESDSGVPMLHSSLGSLRGHMLLIAKESDSCTNANRTDAQSVFFIGERGAKLQQFARDNCFFGKLSRPIQNVCTL